MKMKERKLESKNATNIFKIVAKELEKNVNMQIIIHESILTKLQQKSKKHKVSISDCLDTANYKVEKWYTLHKGKSSETEEISQLGVRKISKDFYQVTVFRGFSFGFSYLEEYVYDEYKAKKFLVIHIQKK